jgi:NAD(P)H-flavin reductase
VALSKQLDAQQTSPFTIQHGHVQDILMKKNPNPATDLVYLCGNPKMIDDNFELLKNLGFSVQQIVREKYLSR